MAVLAQPFDDGVLVRHRRLERADLLLQHRHVLALRGQLVADVVERQSDVRLDRSTVQVEKRDGTR